MSVAKVVEITATSVTSFDDAIRQRLRRASHTIEQIKSAWIEHQRVLVDDGKITDYRVAMKFTFVVHGDHDDTDSSPVRTSPPSRCATSKAPPVGRTLYARPPNRRHASPALRKDVTHASWRRSSMVPPIGRHGPRHAPRTLPVPVLIVGLSAWGVVPVSRFVVEYFTGMAGLLLQHRRRQPRRPTGAA